MRQPRIGRNLSQLQWRKDVISPYVVRLEREIIDNREKGEDTNGVMKRVVGKCLLSHSLKSTDP